MQEKKRYLLVTFEPAGPGLSKPQAAASVSQAVIDGVGELGASRAKAFLKEFDEAGQRGVVKCQTAMLDEVIACLALKAPQSGGPAVRVWKVSGAIANVWDGGPKGHKS